MPHFGEGGFVDYVLAEIAWMRWFPRTTHEFIGQHRHGDGGYLYDAPFYWWDQFIQKTFRRAVGECRLRTSAIGLRVA